MGCQRNLELGPQFSQSTQVVHVVVGEQDVQKLAGHQKSSKHRKAEELVRLGQNIRIVHERDFLHLVGEQEEGR